MLNKLVESVLLRNSNLRLNAEVVEKEILHHDLLLILEEAGLLTNLTFIGGTCLRLCYNSSRLSEDLDFTGGVEFAPSSFDGLTSHIKIYLENKYGLDVDVYEPKESKTDTSTWKVTINKNPSRSDLPSQKMHIDVCAFPSFERTFRPVIDHYNLGSPLVGLPIPVQSRKEILADKMVAFAFRQRRIKQRDVWDIAWLKQQGVNQDEVLVARKLKVRQKDQEEFIDLINRHIQLLRDDNSVKQDFKQEMSRFLPSDVISRTLQHPQFWNSLVTLVEEEVAALERALKGKNFTF